MEEEGKRRESCSFNSFFLCFSSFSFFATTTSEKQTRSCTLHRNSSVHPFLINPLVLQRGLGSALAASSAKGGFHGPSAGPGRHRWQLKEIHRYHLSLRTILAVFLPSSARPNLAPPDQSNSYRSLERFTLAIV